MLFDNVSSMNWRLSVNARKEIACENDNRNGNRNENDNDNENEKEIARGEEE